MMPLIAESKPDLMMHFFANSDAQDFLAVTERVTNSDRSSSKHQHGS
jgi:hypothetical protein